MRKGILSLFVFSVLAFAVDCQSPSLLRLTFLGDIMGHTVNYRIADFHDIFAEVKELLLADDLTIGNLEFPVDQTRPIRGYPAFNGTRKYWQAAVDSGVDVFSLANNHSFDQGLEGILQTLRSVEAVGKSVSRPFYVSGLRGNLAAAFVPQEIRVKGFRVGFLAATQFINQYPVDCPYVNIVNHLNRGAADRFIRLVKDRSGEFDVFIVSYHGGIEFSPGPNDALLSFFRKLLENGADIVFGHHPHVYQSFGMATVKGETKIILPSMGNFISGMTWGIGPTNPDAPWAPTGDSALVFIDLLQVGTSLVVARAEALPTSNYLNEQGSYVVGKLEDLVEGKNGFSEAWIPYYRYRMNVMKKLLPPFSMN
jgi:hypothetical protein